MSKCRVKVRVEHMQKTFYERLLYVWRQQTEDKNQKFVIYKAYVNLKNYPLEVRTVAELKHIHGIGEALAARCYLAWEAACASCPILDLKIIKEDFIRFIEVAKRSGSIEIPPPTNRTARLSKRSGKIYPEKEAEQMLAEFDSTYWKIGLRPTLAETHHDEPLSSRVDQEESNGLGSFPSSGRRDIVKRKRAPHTMPTFSIPRFFLLQRMRQRRSGYVGRMKGHSSLFNAQSKIDARNIPYYTSN
ncbi:unnamed protein product [Angiostrongylus costaricensis]|uniref:HRDC domain-containing protein n=1 Tax=Angiostrongylus costaricensis TaxID=334426 RepID=A0A158PFM5_ANGCS|nr:unnamed protein product [Angiostrongylus costaricensis]